MTFGFIVLRHVSSVSNDIYWKMSYKHIRKYYPENLIIIIDDNSKEEYIDKEFEKTIYKTTIIASEYPGRGELLPYIYFSRLKFFDTAVIIHDSVFINSIINIDVETYSILWTFSHTWDEPINEINLLSKLDNSEELVNFYRQKDKWLGCFGGMSIVNYEYVNFLNNRYNFSRLIDHIKNRYDRMRFERVIACILQFQAPFKTSFGRIHSYCEYGITLKEIDKIKHLPVIKVWVGR
jgi:hypothetical protein